MLSSKAFDLSVTLLGYKTSGLKRYEHMVLQNCELSLSLLTLLQKQQFK